MKFITVVLTCILLGVASTATADNELRDTIPCAVQKTMVHLAIIFRDGESLDFARGAIQILYRNEYSVASVREVVEVTFQAPERFNRDNWEEYGESYYSVCLDRLNIPH